MPSGANHFLRIQDDDALLKADRIGLVIVLASLLAISTIAYVVFHVQHEQRLETLRSQGVSLVRILSGVPYDQLLPGGKHLGVMQVLQHGANSDDFAYVNIVDMSGGSVNEVVTTGLIIPPADIPTEPSTWLGERQLQLAASEHKIIEFHAPLFEANELRGFVRLAYRYPNFGLAIGQVPFLAAVALPVFLLVPLFYVLLRMEVRQIGRAHV